MENAIEVLNALTIEEKAALLEGVDSWETNAIPRFKIRRLFMTDGPHGLRKVRHENGGLLYQITSILQRSLPRPLLHVAGTQITHIRSELPSPKNASHQA